MENKIEIIKECRNPKILVVTPLLPEHKVSKITKKTLKRNDIDYYWISSSGNNNIPTNALEGIKWYKNKFCRLPEYYMMVDNDIEAGRNLLDRLYNMLSKTTDNIGYCYASFEFKGHINVKFPAINFDANRLIQSNYISSNSLFKSEVIEKVGLVTDDKYRRLLDWAFLIKCLGEGYIGINQPNASFVAYSDKKSVSSGSNDDYQVKYRRVFEDFIKPLIERK
jgi:hypothetical protein